MKIMFVCHGNICRSPMAEFIFRHLAKLEELDVFADSSATSTEEIWNGVGSPLYPPAAEQLRIHAIPYENRRAKLLCRSDYEKYDLFVGMDSANVRDIHRIFGRDPKSKVCKLMNFTDRGGDVSDPWYTRRFETAYNDIYKGCAAIIKLIKENQI